MMDFRISDLEQQSKASGATVHQTVDGVLQSDDRLLSSLQKLGWELERDNPEEDEAVKGLRDICMRWVFFSQSISPRMTLSTPPFNGPCSTLCGALGLTETWIHARLD